MMKTKTLGAAMKAALLTLAALAAHGSEAAVRIGDSGATGVAAGTSPELMLVIWDPVKEVSYTKDLGLSVYKEFYEAGTTATNLFVYGQQDTGYQKLFDPLNTDTNFQTFLSKSTDAANQIWAVIAIASDPSGAFAGSRAMYTTLKHATATDTTNPEYTRVTTWPQGDFGNAEGSLESYVRDVSTVCTGSGCDQNFTANLSTYNAKGDLAYAGAAFSTAAAPSGGSATLAPSVFNKVNSSSWFYSITMPTDDGDQAVAVDEFDNLGHDAYWGLGVDSNGNYILSYTMEASLTQAQTAQGQMLRLRTDFAANYGGTRFIGAPVGDTLNLGGGAAITPVPEPSTWGLMGLGLALLAGRARRQKNA